MFNKTRISRAFLWLILLMLAASGANAQKSKSKKAKTDAIPAGQAVLWEPVKVENQNLFDGPGGTAMRPDLSSIKFIEDDKGGHNKKYKISDGSGNVWVAKPGREARPETVAVRLLWGLGYVTEINYLVPTLTIPNRGTFTNVRLEARPKNVKRLDPWKWRDNPFVGTNELQGLKMMMVFMTNYDLLDMQNKVLEVKDGSHPELRYVISDLGSTFGRLGNNNLPILFRIGRVADSPKAWRNAKFIKGVKDGELRMAYTGGKSRGIMKGISVEQGRWLADLLNRLSDSQIRDAFRAANYSPAEIDIMSGAFRRRVDELNKAVGERNLAGK
jgi:hypothetical protein